MASNVKVLVRFRPQNELEKKTSGQICANFHEDGKTVSLTSNSTPYTFDHVFQSDTTQKEIYEIAAKPIVEDILAGYNGTIFAYGQTASGKTFTMSGPDFDSEFKGVIPRIFDDIFNYMSCAPESIEFTVKISFVEIYLEKIRDLFNVEKKNLQVNENAQRGVFIKNATEMYVSSVEEMLEAMKKGNANRNVSATKMNAESSRSHSVFMITIGQKDTVNNSSKAGKLYMVDLAGSEKVLKTEAEGLTLDEAKAINKSLSTLGNVITALTNSKAMHVPYRDSKLTRVLQESLGGNAKTTIVVACSPSSYNEAETLSSLRFGSRAKNIKNKAKVNQELSVSELTKQLNALKKQMNTMKTELSVWRSGGTPTIDTNINVTPDGKSSAPVSTPGSPNKKSADVFARENELLDLLAEKEKELEKINSLSSQAVVDALEKENIKLNENIQKHEFEKNKMAEELTEHTITIETLTKNNKTIKTSFDNSKKVSETTQREHSREIAKLKDEQERILEETDLKYKQLLHTSEEQKIKITSLEMENTGLIEKSLTDGTREEVIQEIKASLEKNTLSKEEHERILKEHKNINDQLQFELHRQTRQTKNMLACRQDVENTMQKLTKVLEQLVAQNSQLKFEQSISEKKLNQRTQRIHTLETKLMEMEQNQTKEELEHKFMISRLEKDIAALKNEKRTSFISSDREHELHITKIIRGAGRTAGDVSSPSLFWKKSS